MRGAIVLAAVVLAAPAVHAGKGYVGGSVGQTAFDLGVGDLDDGSFTSGSADDSDTGWKVFGGFEFLKFFALEGAYQDLGGASIHAVSDGTGTDFAPGPVSADLDFDAISLFAVGRLPLGPVTVFAKYGYASWDAKIAIADSVTSGSSSDDGEDPVYGVGLDINLPGPVAIRVEWEQYPDPGDGDIDVDFASAGVKIIF